MAPYSLSEPLRPKYEGDFRKTDIPIDAYLPANCGWHFAGIRYLIPNMWPQSEILVSYQDQGARPDSSPASHVDVWCIKDKRAPEPKVPERCMGWWMLTTGGGWVKPDFGKSISVSHSGQEPPLRITADMSEIDVQFHDVDSMMSNLR
jgi:hypothetical protein